MKSSYYLSSIHVKILITLLAGGVLIEAQSYQTIAAPDKLTPTTESTKAAISQLENKATAPDPNKALKVEIKGPSENSKPTVSSDYHFPLPKGYNKLVLPIVPGVSPVVPASVSIFIRSVLDIDEKNEIITLDADFGLRWQDKKILNYLNESGGAYLKDQVLDSQILSKIWKPDIFIDQMASVENTSILGKLATLKFFGKTQEHSGKLLAVPGDFLYFGRTTLKLRCEMNFRYYPADIQTCEFDVRSYSYQRKEFRLSWEDTFKSPDLSTFTHGVFLNDPSDPNFDIQVESALPLDNKTKLNIEEKFNIHRRGNYSALQFTLKARRKLSYHLVQTYLPSILLILITWLCFLLPSNMVEARIGISMTTLLTLTAMFATVRQESPTVSYTMAIDIWMVFCIFIVFVALSLFTFICWTKRRVERILLATLSAKSSKTFEEPEAEILQESKESYKTILKFSKRYAFCAFLIIYSGFFFTYWVWLLSFSEYFDWTVDPVFNAVDDESKLYQLRKFDL